MENSDSIPWETRAPGNNGEPIHHIMGESNGETTRRENSSPKSTGHGFVHQLYGNFTEIVKHLLLEARESQRQQFDYNYRTLAHELARIFTYIS